MHSWNYRAYGLQTGQVVAIKKILLGKAKEGVNVTALREIKLLKELHGPRIVQLLDVFPHKGNLSLVSGNEYWEQGGHANSVPDCLSICCYSF